MRGALLHSLRPPLPLPTREKGIAAPAPHHDRRRNDTASIVDRSRIPSRRADQSWPRISRPHGGVRARRGKRCCSRCDGTEQARRGAWRAQFPDRPATALAWSPAATTARWWRPIRRGKRGRLDNRPQAALDRPRRHHPNSASPGRAASRPSCAAPGAAQPRGAVERRRPHVRAEGISPRDRALQRRDAAVSQCADAKPETLEWKGSHLDVTFSPDGRFLVTAMQEPTLHGWRLVDSKHMRMSGYAARCARSTGRRRPMARDLGLEPARPVAVRRQGRPDGQDAEGASAVRAPRRGGRLPSQPGRRRRRLRGRHGAAHPHRRRRRDPGARPATRRSRRSPGAPTARCSRSAPRAARPAFSTLPTNLPEPGSSGRTAPSAIRYLRRTSNLQGVRT